MNRIYQLFQCDTSRKKPNRPKMAATEGKTPGGGVGECGMPSARVGGGAME